MIDLPAELVSRVECNDGAEHALEDRRVLYLLVQSLAARLHNADACIDAIARALRGQGVNDQYEAWDRIGKFVAEYRTNPAGKK